MSAETMENEQALLALEDEIHRQITYALEKESEDGRVQLPPDRDVLMERVSRMVNSQPQILTREQRSLVARSIVDRIVGFGPLEPLLEDPTINEIMVNDPENVFIERDGRIEQVEVRFRDEAHLRHVIDRIVAPIGRRIDESSPLVDARLPDGSRVNAIIPPLAIQGPTLTIRKFSRQPFTLERLVSLGTISEPIADFLKSCVRNRMSMIISGGTGSGKTSTLNALGFCIHAGERIITIEDSAELQLDHPHLVSLESRPPNIENEGEIPIRTLVRNALRMRPDRIIVGEVRGGEAFDMLQAMNTGHRGSLTTLHANSPADAMVRLESMVLMAGFDMPISAIRRMIIGAIEIVIQQDRLLDGKRVITAIMSVDHNQMETVDLHPLYLYEVKRGKHLAVETKSKT
ncbi:MAG: CpaF family protein [Anaerolineales bacterium]